MTAEMILKEGLVTVTRPGAHTGGKLARSRVGATLKPTSMYASAWDSTGAAMKAARTDVIRGDDLEGALELLRLAAVEQGQISPRMVDDTHGQKGAIRMYRRAIELFELHGQPALAHTGGSTR